MVWVPEPIPRSAWARTVADTRTGTSGGTADGGIAAGTARASGARVGYPGLPEGPIALLAGEDSSSLLWGCPFLGAAKAKGYEKETSGG